MNLLNQKGFSPIFIIIGIVVLLVIGFLGYNLKFKNQSKPAYNTQIMYGYKDYDEYLSKRSDFVKRVDERFINSEIKSQKTQNRGELSQVFCTIGLDLLAKRDFETAIKRFNQAWLLDHNQPCVYALYGSYIVKTSKAKEPPLKAYAMYDKALLLSKTEDSWWILTDYAEVLGDYYYYDDRTKTDYLDKAMQNLNKSLAIKDAPKTHRVLAFTYFYSGDFKESWKHVHLAIDGGVPKGDFGNFIEDELKKEMPDPEGKIQ